MSKVNRQSLVEVERPNLAFSQVLGEIEITEANQRLYLDDLLRLPGLQLLQKYMWEPGDKIQIVWRFNWED